MEKSLHKSGQRPGAFRGTSSVVQMNINDSLSRQIRPSSSSHWFHKINSNFSLLNNVFANNSGNLDSNQSDVGQKIWNEKNWSGNVFKVFQGVFFLFSQSRGTCDQKAINLERSRGPLLPPPLPCPFFFVR